jgi:ATP-dependent helicase HepA
VEFGSTATVDSLPGLPGHASFLGTFDREAAVADETLDFFAFGHPLVEGLLADLEESPRGRVGLLKLRHAGDSGEGLVGVFRSQGRFEIRVVDGRGRRRDDWRDALLRRPFEGVARSAGREGWLGPLVERLSPRLGPEVPVALAALLVEGQELRAPSHQTTVAAGEDVAE